MSYASDLILFLDVDGVLNRCGASGHGLEPDKCDLLADICRRTGCKIVVSSTWRTSNHLLKGRLLPMFVSRGIECIGVTPTIEIATSPGGLIVASLPRREEIKAWLADHPGVRNYAILDDDCDADDGTGRFVRTGSYEGIQIRHVDLIERAFTLPSDATSAQSHVPHAVKVGLVDFDPGPD